MVAIFKSNATEEHTHIYNTEWKSDSTTHWHECSCGDKTDIANHVSDGGKVTVQPTATTTGIRTYSCSVCGYVMSTEVIPVLNEEHTHSYDTIWKSDSIAHWHECSCGDKTDIANHVSDGGKITVQPTATTTGVRTYSCSVCGYVMNTETIPATGSNDIPSYPSNNPPSNPYYNTPAYPASTPVSGPAAVIPSAGAAKLTVKAEVKKDTVTLSWDKINGAKNYTVYQYKDGKYVAVKTTEKTSVTFKKLKNGKTYKFLVRYTKSGKLSSTANSGKVSVTVKYKPIVRATSTENSITLKWSAVEGAEKYAVYKYVNGKAVKLTETDKRAVKYGKLNSHTKYRYIVRAYVDGKWTSMTKSDIVTVETK